MIRRTLLLVGPGGIGKSPLSRALRSDIVQIDPYRMRSGGPRDKMDTLYAAQSLREELKAALQLCNVNLQKFGNVEWYAQAKLGFIKVRDDWQLLVLSNANAELAKAEIYAPVIPNLLGNSEISRCFGDIFAVVLQPSAVSLQDMRNWDVLKELTRIGCEKRGDGKESIQKRVESIDEEAPAWKYMIEKMGAIEIKNWQFSEYNYKLLPVNGQFELLVRAKREVLHNCPGLDPFFKTDDEIISMNDPVTFQV